MAVDEIEDGSLTFGEFILREPVPLAKIHAAVLQFLRQRDDAVVFGAFAVNAYVDVPRMSQDIDILSTRAAELADEIRTHLASNLKIAVRARAVAGGRGFRLYQVRKPKNRHLVDVRAVKSLPASKRVGGVSVAAPAELISMKVVSVVARSRTPKGSTDNGDIRRLLLAFPDLKVAEGPVRECLRHAKAPGEVLAAWDALVREEIRADDEDSEFE